MLGDRRQADRIACRIGAVMLDDATGAALALDLTDISEGGAFVHNEQPVRPGSRIKLRFEHPKTGRRIEVEGRVARRVLGRPDREEETGNGVYFDRPLSRFDAERRGAERKACKLHSTLHIGAMEAASTLEDISEGGALLRTSAEMQIGAVIRLQFRHPHTGKEADTWALVVRGPLALPDGGRGFGVCFDETLSELAGGDSWERNEKTGMLSPKLPPQGERVHNWSDEALAEQGMTRRVIFVDEHGGRHRGSLILAGRTELLVQCEALPGKGARLALGLRRPRGTGLDPIRIFGRVRRAGGTTVHGWRPGFVVAFDRFGSEDEELDWRAFVAWLESRAGAH